MDSCMELCTPLVLSEMSISLTASHLHDDHDGHDDNETHDDDHDDHDGNETHDDDIEGDDVPTPQDVLNFFDANNDSLLSFDEFWHAWEEDEESYCYDMGNHVIVRIGV